MIASEQKRFDDLYEQHLRALKLQGYSASTIDVYARAVRRVTEFFDCVPDQLSIDQLTTYFAELVEERSWSLVKIDRNGLQFFWKHILKQDWHWVEIIKPPRVRTLPDVLSVSEVERLIGAARRLRYRVFVLATYSMGLRLSETLSLEVSDIDAPRQRVHIRRGKGHKDRFVPLPDLTYQALRELWARHRHPRLLFPNPVGSGERIRQAARPMDRGGVQQAVKAMVADCGIKKRSASIPFATVWPPICWNKA
jgi:integrase/recombinase XerD